MPLLRAHCGACHFDGETEGGVRLDDIGLLDGPSREIAIAAWRNIRASTMPPAGEPQPTAAERRDLLQRLERDIFGIDATRPDPGRTVLRRLNRVEYAATVRDLTGLDIDLVDDLPADDTGYGFDTIGSVLTLSPLLLEKYMALATRVAERVVAEAEAPDSTAQPLSRIFPLGLAPADPLAQPLHLWRTLEILASRGFRHAALQRAATAWLTHVKLMAVVSRELGARYIAALQPALGVGMSRDELVDSLRESLDRGQADETLHTLLVRPGYLESIDSLYRSMQEGTAGQPWFLDLSGPDVIPASTAGFHSPRYPNARGNHLIAVRLADAITDPR